MQREKMWVVTGAAGFIGSYVAGALLQAGCRNLVLVDDFSRASRRPNYAAKPWTLLLDRDLFPAVLEGHAQEIAGVIHLGARTDTAEQDRDLFYRLNLAYSQRVWEFCTRHQLPMVYASSAATYGDGAQGFSDDPAGIPALRPLNPYGQSKQDFDCWVLQQVQTPPRWMGYKFFNVFGPNEQHKGRMASVVFHAWNQIRETGGMRLFRSHRPDFTDGGQMRDFIYVKDIAAVILWWMQQETGAANGIYNLGTGRARSFLDLAHATFAAMGVAPSISWMDTPADIRDTYQYFTEADMARLRAAGCPVAFTPLEDAVTEYVQAYLNKNRIC